MNILDLIDDIDQRQRQVRQLPADFQPANTSPQLSGPYPGRNATRGYLVGEEQELEEVFNPLDDERRQQRAMDREREQFKRDELEFELRGEQERMRVANEGTFYLRIDGRIWSKSGQPVTFQGRERAVRAGQTIKDRDPQREVVVTRNPKNTDTVAESRDPTYEDILTSLQRRLGDYLQDVATAVKKDPDLLDRVADTTRDIQAIKTIRTDDGHEIKIHGNEDDGFRISIRNQDIKSRFGDLDEAVIAAELYCARRRSSDYLDEKSLAETKKDACYHKVKSRYKVWPSAYASGALVQCRKKGAKNWGNKSTVNEGWRETLAALAAAGIMALSPGVSAADVAADSQQVPMIATIVVDGEVKKLDLTAKGFRDVREVEKFFNDFFARKGVPWQGRIERGVPGSGQYQRLIVQ